MEQVITKKIYIGSIEMDGDRLEYVPTVRVGYEEHGKPDNFHVVTKVKILDPRNDLVNHSPDGFQWGYGGSGPAQLSLAILADLLGSWGKALAYYQSFKFAWTAKLAQGEPWILTQDKAMEILRGLEGWVE